MSGPAPGTEHWPVRLSHLASLVSADGLAMALLAPGGRCVTYAEHNVATNDWETDGDMVVRAAAERAPVTAVSSLLLRDGRPARALCAAPLIRDDRAIGALVGLRAQTPWAEDDQRALVEAAALAALELGEADAALQAQHAAEEVVRQARVRDEFLREIQIVEDPESMLARAAQRVAELFSADGVSLMLVEPDGELVVRSAIGLPQDIARQARRRLGEGIAGWVAQHGEPLLLSGRIDESRFRGIDASIASALVAPVRADGRILGVVNVKARHGERKYDLAQLADLVAVGQHLGFALSRAQALRARAYEIRRDIDDDRGRARVLFELSRLAVFGGQSRRDLDIVVALLRQSLRHDVVGLWIARENAARLRLAASYGYSQVLPQEIEIEADATLRAAFVERRTQHLDPAERTSWAGLRASSYVLAPIIAQSKSVGVLVVGRADGSYAEAEVEFTTTVAEYLGVFVRRLTAEVPTGASPDLTLVSELRHGLAQGLTDVVLTLEVLQRLLRSDPTLADRITKAVRDARTYLEQLQSPVAKVDQSSTGGGTSRARELSDRSE